MNVLTHIAFVLALLAIPLVASLIGGRLIPEGVEQ